jgi:CO/xanthine dehydrogenase Mo-binding subunit
MAEVGKIASPPAGRQTERPNQKLAIIGTRMKRKEDPRFLTGHGRFVDDIALPNMAHAAALRSPHAHARIRAIDKREAEALPGVLAVITGEEAARETAPLPCFANPPVEQRCIALGKVRHVGEPVALVVAESRYIAEDAAALIKVDYQVLPAVSDMMEAIHSTGEAVLHPERGPTNVAEHRKYLFGPVEEEFAHAAHIVKRRLRWSRSGGQPLETVGAVARFDEGAGKFTIYANTSMYNYIGFTIAASLKVDSHLVNIVPVDAGGSFGSKLFVHKVPVLAALAARHVGRPVKYVEDRIDNMSACDNHGSDRTYEAELALDAQHRMMALRYKVVDDYGAYLQYGLGTHGNGFSQTVGPYKIRAVGAEIIAVFTNKTQQGACRGFGSEVTNFLIERMVDAAVSALDLDPVQFRRDNFIQPHEFPYQIPTGNLYDSGDYPGALDMALTMLDYEGWRRKQREARAEGRYVGIGLASCQEKGVFSATEFWMLNREKGFALTSSPESVAIKIDPNGKAVISLNAPHWGNSPETVAAMVLAEQLTLDPADISVTYADTDHGLPGTGPGGSRYTVMVTGAVAGAARILKAKLLRVASHMLEAAPYDLEFREGKIGVKGVPGAARTIAEVAMQAHMFRLSFPDDDMTSGLDASYTYDHPLATLPKSDSDFGIFYPIMGHMCHMPVVEVDPKTGKVSILDYVAVHDCGTMINPMTVDGHVRGGTAQGVGTAFFEEFQYDREGQLLGASFTDYLIPRVAEMPSKIRIGHLVTPSPYTEYGVKGAGEGGRMVAPPALASAVEDALRPLGVKIDTLPATPARLRALIREAEARGGAHLSGGA